MAAAGRTGILNECYSSRQHSEVWLGPYGQGVTSLQGVAEAVEALRKGMVESGDMSSGQGQKGAVEQGRIDADRCPQGKSVYDLANQAARQSFIRCIR